ncbi:DUF3376 domain-containing protein [Geodermatophilus sp. URMC 64]
MSTPSRPELRLALVMNGGVSLAVWMAGVTHEIDLLRRASESGADGDADVPVYDRFSWQQWKAAAEGRRVVVDIVAGTSAGGINGALLAAAVAGGGRLDWPDAADAPGARRRTPFLRELWEVKAGLEHGKLLPDEQDEQRSLLNGRYLTEQVVETLDALGVRSRLDQARRVPSAPQPPPVTLFVTATALGRADQEFRDGFDQAFKTQDHRRLYRFRHDPSHEVYVPDSGEFEDRDLQEFSQYADELATAVRASASYPVAFEPVQETPTMAGPPLRVLAAADTEQAWLADGGILDNAPFGPVLDSISRRAPDTDVERLLVYVVPSRGTESGEHARTTEGPPELTSVLANAVLLPREGDFRTDIDELDHLIHAVDTEAQAVDLFDTALSDGTGSTSYTDVQAAAGGLLATYWRGRSAGRIVEARSLAGGADRLRAHDLRSPTAQFPASPAATSPGTATTALRPPPPAFGPGVSPLATPWEWGVAAAERCVRLLARDLMRRLHDGQDVSQAAREVSHALRRIEAVSDALEAALRAEDVGRFGTDEQAAEVVDEVCERLKISVTLQQCLQTAATAFAEGLRQYVPEVQADDALRLALAVEICARALHAGAPYRRTPLFRFLRLGPDVDAPVLDAPGTSPLDQSGAAAAFGDRKLYGSRASHFAGFGKPEWRVHDWLWGRLDAIAHLGRVLGQSREWVRAMQEAVLAHDGGDPDGVRLRANTEALVTDDPPYNPLAELRSTDSGRQTLKRLEQRAARVAADSVDIPKTPEFAERLLARWLLGEVLPD